jgi:hypothetical protein
VRVAPFLAAAVLVVIPAGCGTEPADSTPADLNVYESAEWGYAVTIPPGWQRAENPLATMTDPVEVLVAATYRPSPGSQGCGPVALAGFDSDEALVTILERGLAPASYWSDFPPRPAQFEFEGEMSSEFTNCLRERHGIPLKDHWFRFTDAGRHFHVLVAIGADAPPEAEREAYGLLDSLRFDPNVKPDWRSSE